MADPAQTAKALEGAFRRIHATRMADVPILNPKLSVEVVNARDWNGHTLAALVTPWFINLMLMPESTEHKAAFGALPIGTKQMHRFPAGRFEFIVGDEAALGRFEMCSLFSPVLEFESHEAARIAAAASLDALFDASLDPTVEPDEAKTGAGSTDATSSPGRTGAVPDSVPPQPSRRGFLTGRIAPREGSAS